MTPRTRRHLLLLTIALLVLFAITGCATFRYEWQQVRKSSEFYYWERVNPSAFSLVCGFRPQSGFRSGGACALQTTNSPLHDYKRVDGHGTSGNQREGNLCLIFATMDENEARRLLAFDELETLYEHELRHCKGWIHQAVPLR